MTSTRITLLPLAVAFVLAALLLLWPLPARIEAVKGFEMKLEDQKSLGESLGVSERGLTFFCFVVEGCPYCARQLRFFSEQYPSSYVECDILKQEDCYEKLVNFLQRSGLIGIVSGVPLTLVFRDGYLLAVVEGANVELQFWEKIAKTSPSENVPLLFGSEEPRVFRCIGDSLCVLEEALMYARLSLAILTISLGVSLSLTLRLALNSRKRGGSRK
ncbi:MAG: hypothetical protein QXN05_00590 [Acidilobaceae archaeon]